jgi:TFIIF-interacting CTD phosphatase-like protein
VISSLLCSASSCRLYGHHTSEHPLWGWVKDLSRLGRDLSRTLIVDDSVLAALLQPCSLVPIRPFDHADPRKDRDTALTELLRFLQDKVSVKCHVACISIMYDILQVLLRKDRAQH